MTCISEKKKKKQKKTMTQAFFYTENILNPSPYTLTVSHCPNQVYLDVTDYINGLQN